VSGGWPLSVLFMLLDKRHGFLAATGVPLDTAWHFIQEVESNYLPLPYHHASHAADVLHASYHLVEHTPMLRDGLTPLDRFVLYVSAACHDLSHPGLNNSFLVNARTPLAMRYNDRSVLESFHISSPPLIPRRGQRRRWIRGGSRREGFRRRQQRRRVRCR